jgi:hypothetical protein
VGSLDTDTLSKAILDCPFDVSGVVLEVEGETVAEVLVTESAYRKLSAAVATSSDETLFHTFASYLRATAK